MQAVDISKIPCKIIQEKCIHCGDCYEICPVGAIIFGKEATDYEFKEY